MAKLALQVVLDAIKEKRIALVQDGETEVSLMRKYRLQIPKALIGRAIEESKITIKHPKTGELITVGSLNGKVFFGLNVVEGDEIAIIKYEEQDNGSMG